MEGTLKSMRHGIATILVALAVTLASLVGTGLMRPTEAQAKPAITTVAQATKKKLIGSTKARNIALSNAKAKKSQVKRLKVELEWDDGRRIYEVEFRKGNYEYEYAIDAYTGKILDKDVEHIKKK